jgi:pyrroline-5-carboxylate reductase
MSTPTIAMIGAGNMGASLIGGIIKNGHPPDSIIASDVDETKLAALQKDYGVRIASNEIALSAADVVIFAVKPQYFAEVAKPLASLVQKNKPLIISIAAGITIASILEWLGEATAVVRCMPNTPALIGCGATGLYANAHVSAQQRQMAESLLQAVGLAVWVEKENLIDSVTALSGSGPAYFFLIMEAMQKTGIELGLDADVAKQLTLQTALGAAKMAMESPKSLEALRQGVTSPGGTTEKAVSVLEEHNVREIFRKALHGAKIRSEELAQHNRK